MLIFIVIEEKQALQESAKSLQAEIATLKTALSTTKKQTEELQIQLAKIRAEKSASDLVLFKLNSKQEAEKQQQTKVANHLRAMAEKVGFKLSS